ncbi:hypothetical protein IFM89_036571 [Coptis chinensis]|uniref:Uncharacterized protein n=1 Tax=Coptis chinensis TaxID=261450 RepID=A0A835LKT4_9MAGN|nr:hypothetical protein IFM89_036571 [Coptis chinensis]
MAQSWNWYGKGIQPVGSRKHPSLFSEYLGVLMATSVDLIGQKLGAQDVGDKEWLWDNIKDKWELDETRKEPTLALISGDEFRNKKSKWKRNFYTAMPHMKSIISHRRATIAMQSGFNLWSFGILRSIKANRAKQIAKHLLWKNKFSQFEEIMSRGWSTPFPRRSFVRTHTSSQTHDALDDQSREYIHKMKDLVGIDEHGTQVPLSDEIYREVMPPERHGRVRLKGQGVTPTSYFGSRLSSDNRVNDLESQLAEMQRVAQEKEEERRLGIEEIKRQAQEKDEQRRHEIDEMKR